MGMDLDIMFMMVLLLSIAAGVGFNIGVEIKKWLGKVVVSLLTLKFK